MQLDILAEAWDLDDADRLGRLLGLAGTLVNPLAAAGGVYVTRGEVEGAKGHGGFPLHVRFILERRMRELRRAKIKQSRLKTKSTIQCLQI